MCEELAAALDLHQVGSTPRTWWTGSRPAAAGIAPTDVVPTASLMIPVLRRWRRRRFWTDDGSTRAASDLQALIAVSDRKRAEALAVAVDEHLGLMGTGHGDSGDDVVRRGVENVMAAAARISSGEEIGDQEIASVACHDRHRSS